MILQGASAQVGDLATANDRALPEDMRVLAGEFVGSDRIVARADRTRYDRVTIALHWLTVALVLEQFLIAQVWRSFDRPIRQTLLTTHTSLGIILAAVIIARIVWRLIPGHQLTIERAGWVEVASNAIHYTLYRLLGSEIVLGFAARWTDNKPLSFFGVLIPAPLGPFSKSTQHIVTNAHEWIAWTIIILAAVHAAAALFHHYVLRDDVLKRMLP